jgi:secreted Zn-dependent insulinase-like peptidase
MSNANCFESSISKQLEKLKQKYENSLQKSSKIATISRVLALKPNKYGSLEKLKNLDEFVKDFNFNAISDFIEQFRNSLQFSSFIQGNIISEVSISFFNEILSKLSIKSECRVDRTKSTVVRLIENQIVVLRQIPTNPNEKNVCVEVIITLYSIFTKK